MSDDIEMLKRELPATFNDYLRQIYNRLGNHIEEFEASHRSIKVKNTEEVIELIMECFDSFERNLLPQFNQIMDESVRNGNFSAKQVTNEFIALFNTHMNNGISELKSISSNKFFGEIPDILLDSYKIEDDIEEFKHFLESETSKVFIEYGNKLIDETYGALKYLENENKKEENKTNKKLDEKLEREIANSLDEKTESLEKDDKAVDDEYYQSTIGMTPAERALTTLKREGKLSDNIELSQLTAEQFEMLAQQIQKEAEITARLDQLPAEYIAVKAANANTPSAYQMNSTEVKTQNNGLQR